MLTNINVSSEKCVSNLALLGDEGWRGVGSKGKEEA
jgi:hypothetical protein